MEVFLIPLAYFCICVSILVYTFKETLIVKPNDNDQVIPDVEKEIRRENDSLAKSNNYISDNYM